MASFAGCGFSPSDNKSSAPASVGSLDPRDLASPPKPQDNITLETPTPNLQNASSTPQDVLSQAGQFEPRPGGMLGALGVNLDSYFAEDIQDPIVRIKRLERAVTAIQRDLKTVAPPIQRLVSVESDIQELVTQLQVLLENDSQPSSKTPASPGSVPKPDTAGSQASPNPQLAEAAGVNEEVPEKMPPEKQATSPPEPPPDGSSTPPPSTAGPPSEVKPQPPPPTPSPGSGKSVTTADASTPSVVDLRVGDHPDKVRFVLDMNAGASFTADLDNEEHILVIELPAAGWATAMEKTFGDSGLLKSYKVEPGDGGKGSRLILQLKKASGILAQQKLDGEGGSGQRIVIDLKK